MSLKEVLTGTRHSLFCSRQIFYGIGICSISLVGLMGCSALVTRPVQELSDATVALRAAKEVQADILAPELFRRSYEWFLRARKEYRFKNFETAKEDFEKARKLAEEAEFEALRNGGNRTEEIADTNPAADSGSGGGGGGGRSVPVPTPEGTPAEFYDQRKAAEDKANQPQVPTPMPGGAIPPGVPGGGAGLPAGLPGGSPAGLNSSDVSGGTFSAPVAAPPATPSQ